MCIPYHIDILTWSESKFPSNSDWIDPLSSYIPQNGNRILPKSVLQLLQDTEVSLQALQGS